MSRCGVCSCAALAQSSGSPPSRQGLPETGEVGIEHSRQSSVCSTSVSSASGHRRDGEGEDEDAGDHSTKAKENLSCRSGEKLPGVSFEFSHQQLHDSVSFP